MPRAHPRKTLARGIYRDGASIEIRVTVGGNPYWDRLPGDTPLDEAKRLWRLLKAHALTLTPRIEKHTLAADAEKYLKLQTHLASFKNRRAILQHWRDVLGHVPRHRITPQDVLAARVAWLEAGAAPKTINHRVATLRHVYITLDGRTANTPCDDIPPLHVPKTPIQRVSDAVILAVDAELQRREADPRIPLRSAKTRARFRVLVSTGRRPSEVMRAEPSDVDLEQRVWVVRDGKGGWSPGVYLNDDMLAAWRLFIEAGAWGHYNTGSFADSIREAGWPADVRPYNARHTTWIMAVERGADMADVSVGAGHKSVATTRIYTGVRNSRMQGLSERLEGRFSGFPVVPHSGPGRK
jgi:integrase